MEINYIGYILHPKSMQLLFKYYLLTLFSKDIVNSYINYYLIYINQIYELIVRFLYIVYKKRLEDKVIIKIYV